jgi:RNA polymerase sigma-70 factor (ECF subfamily)
VTQLSDEQLVAAYRREKDAEKAKEYLGQLFERYQKKVYSWCYKLLNHYDEALDLTQDIFLTVFERLDTYEGKSRFSTWLYQITHNHCLNYFEHAETKLRTASVSMNTDLEGRRLLYTVDPAWQQMYARIDEQEILNKLKQIFHEHLSQQAQEIMHLRYFENMPLDEITKHVGLTNKTGSRAVIQQAERIIKRELQRFLDNKKTRLKLMELSSGVRHG